MHLEKKTNSELPTGRKRRGRILIASKLSKIHLMFKLVVKLKHYGSKFICRLSNIGMRNCLQSANFKPFHHLKMVQQNGSNYFARV